MKRDDSLWKAILEDIFEGFLVFFFPNAQELFDFSQPFQFLDKELEQLFPSNPDDFSPKYVDKLVKVFTKEGQEQWILIHIEVQGNTDKNFSHRMFQYFYRIYDRYQRPITAFAILTDKNKSFKPNKFETAYLGTSLRYEFNLYKILEQNEKTLAASDNPFAMIVLTALVALKKDKLSEEELLSQKIALLKRLSAKGFNREKITALIGFLKLYVRFGNSENDLKFEDELEQTLNRPKATMGIVEFVIERERRDAEKKGIEKGMEKGIEQGIGKGIEQGMEMERTSRNYTFVKSLLAQTDFDDAKIALLAGVSLPFIEEVKKDL